jgi:hypothetical protein
MPYGVVASIVPWNSPDVLAFTQIFRVRREPDRINPRSWR